MGKERMVQSELYFLDYLPLYETEKPYVCHFEVGGIEGAQRTNLQLSPHLVKLQDLRTEAAHHTLSTSGFEWVRQSSTLDVDGLRVSESARGAYCKLMEAFLKKHLGGQYAFTFQTIIRKTKPDFKIPAYDGVEIEQAQNDRPIQAAHLDYSPASAKVVMQKVVQQRVELGIITEAEGNILKECQFQLINTWRPLSTVADWPLAMCDYQTLEPGQMFVVDQVWPHKVDEGLNLHYSEKNQWYYISGQELSDVMLFRIHSSTDQPVGAHASGPLIDDETNECSRRESIETRVFLFHIH